MVAPAAGHHTLPLTTSSHSSVGAHIGRGARVGSGAPTQRDRQPPGRELGQGQVFFYAIHMFILY